MWPEEGTNEMTRLGQTNGWSDREANSTPYDHN
jgi:hypothetical protein